MRGEIAEGSVKFIWMNRLLPYTFIAYQVKFNPEWLKSSSLSRSYAGAGTSQGFLKFMLFFSLVLSLITLGRGSVKYMMYMIRHLQFIFHMAIFSYTLPPIYLSFI